MRNLKLTIVALGTVLLSAGCSCPGQPGYFARMRSCMCQTKAQPVSYAGPAGAPSGPVIFDGPMVPQADGGGSIPRINNPQIDEQPGKQMPFVPPEKNTSRPAKPITAAKNIKELGAGN